MSDPDERKRNSALMKGAAAFELLMNEVGTETSPTEDYGRVAYLSDELTKATEEARSARAERPAGEPGSGPTI